MLMVECGKSVSLIVHHSLCIIRTLMVEHGKSVSPVGITRTLMVEHGKTVSPLAHYQVTYGGTWQDRITSGPLPGHL